MKNVVKEFEASLQPGSMDQAGDRLRAAISVIDQTAQKGVIHRNKAARKISRLVRRFNKVTESQRG
jgi:small subunit ribosomal protein S20